MIYLLGKGETIKYLFRAANVWWRCAQYFVIASCDEMPRDNRCVYIIIINVAYTQRI